MSTNRYAILVGINDYKSPDELHYCDNDVFQIKQRLISNCNFLEDNIFEIISTENRHQNALERYLETIKKLESKVSSDTDCVLFYFSGHGEYLKDTFLHFHEEKVRMQSVFNDINLLNPQHKIFIIDACHSGVAIEFKNRVESYEINELYRQRYIADAKGVFFLCSCKSDEKSVAIPVHRNGLYTKFLIEAIDKKKLYNETNSLSLFNMHEYALIKILYSGSYKQTPFIQSQISGYYPFASFNGKSSIADCSIEIRDITEEQNVADFFFDERLNLDRNIRRDLTQFVSEIVMNLLEHNYSDSVSFNITGNQLIITENSKFEFNTFDSKPTDEGRGLKVYALFLEKYKDLCTWEFLPGPPNKYIFTFSVKLAAGVTELRPCNIKVQDLRLFYPKDLKEINFDLNCDELIVDITKSSVLLSLSPKLFDYIILVTDEKKPLIILKMDEEDMLRGEIRNILKRQPKYNRIMLL